MHGFLNLIYRFYPLAIAGLLAIGAIWLERVTRGPELSADTAISQTPDFTGETVRITGFAEDGKLRYTLDSPRITHIPITNSTHIVQPQLQLITQERLTRINADHGEVDQKGLQVNLTGNVEVEREGAPPAPPLRLSSAQLTVWPQEQRAVSNVPVHLTQGETRADADNFEADNVFGVIKLSGKARMRFASRKQRNPNP